MIFKCVYLGNSHEPKDVSLEALNILLRGNSVGQLYALYSIVRIGEHRAEPDGIDNIHMR